MRTDQWINQSNNQLLQVKGNGVITDKGEVIYKSETFNLRLFRKDISKRNKK